MARHVGVIRQELGSALLQQAATATAPRRKLHVGDAIFAAVARFSGAFVLVLLGAIIVLLFLGGLATFRAFGPAFLISVAWDPVKEVFGAAVSIYGTIVTSILALVLA